MRVDLGMSPGKLAAQTAHAAVLALGAARKDYTKSWKRDGMTKIVLEAKSESELIELLKRAVAAYLPCALVADEGRTEVVPGTITGLGIGPAPSELIDTITGHLRLYGKAEETKEA